MDRSGQVLLGKYELTRMLGKGGMGEVWEGEHQLTGRRVAVKILSDAYLGNKKVVARFGREARAASAVQHEGIVEIFDQDRTAEGVPFLVMEFLDGESVGQRIKRKGKLDEDEALAVVLPMLDALDAAHQAGVIHRDLKPDNVYIMPGMRGDERVKILDFGISQKADEIEHRLTQEGSVLGTPHYMSPEQARGEANIDVRVDVYAASVLLYECVVGHVPFDAGNYNALLQIIISQPPAPPRARGAAISRALEQVILAGLAKRREERPPNARVLRELLLEAGMQGDAAQLERGSWKFKSQPRASQPALLSSLAPRSAPGFDDAELEADLFKPARTTGSFAIPRRDRHLEPVWNSGPAVERPSLVPPPPSEALPPLTIDHERMAARPSAAALQLELAEPPRGPRAPPRTLPRRPTGEASAKRPTRASGVFRTVVQWLLALIALAVLAYVASAVFTRHAPRRSPRVPASSAPQPAGERGSP